MIVGHPTPTSSREPPRGAPQKVERLRSATDSDIFGTGNFDGDDIPPHKARLYQLFTMIEKEFDRLHAENAALRTKVSEGVGEAGVPPEVASEGPKSGRKIQMGQKLRTALGRGPPGRLVFKVGGGDSQKLRVVQRFEGHRDGVWHVDASEKAGIVATASADQTSRVWSLETGECVSVYAGHTGSVNCVAISPSLGEGGEAHIATAGGDETAHVWKTPLPSWRSPQGDPGTMNQGSSGEEKEEEDKEKEHHDVENDPRPDALRVRSPLIRLTGHTGVVIGCDWLTGGNELITASWDRTANIYDVERGDVVSILSGHELELTSCSAHPFHRLVATASKDCTFRLWDFRETIHSVAVFQGHAESVSSVAFSTGDRIVSAADDRTVKVWDMRNMRCAQASVRLSSSVNRIAVSRVTSNIAVPLDNSHLRIFDINGQRIPGVPNRRCHNRIVCCAAWADGASSNLITCGFDRQVIGWRVALKEVQ